MVPFRGVRPSSKGAAAGGFSHRVYRLARRFRRPSSAASGATRSQGAVARCRWQSLDPAGRAWGPHWGHPRARRLLGSRPARM